MSDADWNVLPHGAIEKLSPRLWRVEGSLPNMGLRRVMSVAKLGDGRLVVHNAIALDEPQMQELERWGEIAWVIVPNGYHRLDAPRFAKRYPNAKVLCPQGARKDVEKKVAVQGGYDALPSDPHVSLSMLAGLGGLEGLMTVRDESGASLVFNDAIFNMPHLPGATGFVLKHLTQSTGGPKLTRIGRLFLVKDRRAFADELVRLSSTPELARIIVSHHEMITSAPSDVLRAVAATV